MYPQRPCDAVSPVVGVMLMLAVTVMIAAVASAFAGGFSTTSDKSPQSSLKVTANDPGTNDYYRIYFDHTGGDPFSLDAIKVVFLSDETENKTQITSHGANFRNFTLVGSDETTVRPGDRFYIDGNVTHNTGGDTGIQFGNTVFWNNKKLTWMVIDARSSNTIAMGSLFLPQ